MSPQFVDKLGKPITIGCYVGYGHALGRCAGLRIGKVLDIEVKNPGPYRESDIINITVWGIDDDFAPRPEDDSENWSSPAMLCKTRGILQFPDRIIVLPEEMVPKEYRVMLDPITKETKVVRKK